MVWMRRGDQSERLKVVGSGLGVRSSRCRGGVMTCRGYTPLRYRPFTSALPSGRYRHIRGTVLSRSNLITYINLTT